MAKGRLAVERLHQLLGPELQRLEPWCVQSNQATREPGLHVEPELVFEAPRKPSTPLFLPKAPSCKEELPQPRLVQSLPKRPRGAPSSSPAWHASQFAPEGLTRKRWTEYLVILKPNDVDFGFPLSAMQPTQVARLQSAPMALKESAQVWGSLSEL